MDRRHETLRHAILAGDVEGAEQVALALLADRERLNPTGQELPRGNVAVFMRSGACRVKTNQAGAALERVGAGQRMETQRDVKIAARWFREQHEAEAEGYRFMAGSDGDTLDEEE